MAGLRFCRCGAIVDGKCERCSKQAPPQQDNHDESSTARGYDRQWRNLRERVLARDPLCADCLECERIRPAVEVHHVETIREAPWKRLDVSNLVPLCRACHRARHSRASASVAAAEGGGRSESGGGGL